MLRNFPKKQVNLIQGVEDSHPEANLALKAEIQLIKTIKIIATTIIIPVVSLDSVSNLGCSLSRETSNRYHVKKYPEWLRSLGR